MRNCFCSFVAAALQPAAEGYVRQGKTKISDTQDCTERRVWSKGFRPQGRKRVDRNRYLIGIVRDRRHLPIRSCIFRSPRQSRWDLRVLHEATAMSALVGLRPSP